MGVDSGDHTKSSPSGAVFHIRACSVADVRFGAHSGLKSDIAALPKRADTVAKVENRTTPKISRKSIFRHFYPCKAPQRQYEGP